MDEYDQLLKKYKGDTAILAPTPSPQLKSSVTGDSDYDLFLAKHYTGEKNAKIEKLQQEAEGFLSQQPTIKESIIGTVKELPGAFADIIKEVYAPPDKTDLPGLTRLTTSIVGGALDVGPAIANSLASLFGIKSRLPKPGEALNEYLGLDSDIQKAVRESATVVGGYEIGGGLAKKILGISNSQLITKFAEKYSMTTEEATSMLARNPNLAKQILTLAGGQKFTSTVLGNIIGGQLITEAQTPQERAMQATFDATFGAVIEAGGAILGKAVKAIKGREIAPEIPKVGELPPGGPPGPPGPDSGGPPGPPGPDLGVKPTISGVESAPPQPKVVYKALRDLGKDQTGEKILARTQVDAKTGNAIITYRTALEKDPGLKAEVLDHEIGHVIDKRLNAGSNLSAELVNVDKNQINLSKIFEDFAQKRNADVVETIRELSGDVQMLGARLKGNPAEMFAEAVRQYRANPEAARSIAPTFADFLDYTPVAQSIPRFTERATTIKTLRGPETPKPKTKPTKPFEATVYRGKVKGKADQQLGAFFTTDKKIAQFYSDFKASKLKAKGEVEKTKVRFENPLRVRGSDPIGQFESLQKEIPALKKVVSKVTSKTTDQTMDRLIVQGEKLIADYARKQGHDAVIFGRGETIIDLKPKPKPMPETRPIQKEIPVESKFAGTGLETKRPGVSAPAFNPKSINAPQEVEDLFNQLGAKEGQFAEQRISKGNQDIIDLARITGLTEDQLIKAQPGSIANSETITAARQLVLDKASELINTLKGVDLDVAKPEQLKAIKDGMIKLIAMQKAIAGLRTEASNVFRSLGIELMPGENATMNEIGKILKNLDGFSEGDAELFAKSVGQDLTLTRMQKIGNGLLGTWYASILSGPKTTVRNMLSTSANILTELASKAANPAQWPEVIPSVNGLLKGLKEGWGEAKAVLAGAPASTKFMETTHAGNREIFTGKWMTYGKVVESVGRWLNAQDRFLAAGAQEMERASLEARSPQLSGKLSDAISKSYAESSVYHGVPKGRLIGAVRAGAQTLRRIYPESKIIIPFVDTVANVLDRQFDYLPITSALRLRTSVLEKQADQIIKDFSLAKTDKALIVQRLRDQQIGRLMLGTAVSIGAVILAANRRISGAGPTNFDEKAQLMRTGWRPNSIKIGENWVPYYYLGPLSGIFAMAGNIYDKVTYDKSPSKDVQDLVAKGLVGWTQTQIDQSFLSGVSSLFDVMNGNVTPKSYFERLVTGLVSPPALYSQTKDMIFQQQYETHDIVERIRQRLGLTGDAFGLNPLQPKLDAFGEPMTSDLIFGIIPKKEERDRVDNFLISNDIVVTKPRFQQQYTIPGKKEKRQLTEEEYTKYVQESGKEIYQQILNRIDGLENLREEDKKKEIGKIVSDIRERVRTQILLK